MTYPALRISVPASQAESGAPRSAAPGRVARWRPARAWASALALSLAVAAPEPAAAEGRFSLIGDAGPAAPLRAAPRYTVTIDAEPGESGIPILVHRRARVGFQISVGAVLSAIEVRYELARLAWGEARVACRGDREATQRANGEVEDAGVSYSCGNFGAVPLGLAGGTRLTLHRLTGAYTVPVWTIGRPDTGARVFVVVGSGLVVAQYADPEFGAVARPGIPLVAGAGVDIPLDRRVALVFGMRYSLNAVAGPGSTAARARRSADVGRGVMGTLFDTFHTLNLTGGIKVDFR